MTAICVSHLDALPTSFGALKPVGHVLLAMPTARQATVVRAALQGDGSHDDRVVDFVPADAVAELEAMIASASPMAGFGYELALMRRYLKLARKGHHWLLVRVDGDREAERLGDVARLCGASSAVLYRRLTVEDLL